MKDNDLKMGSINSFIENPYGVFGIVRQSFAIKREALRTNLYKSLKEIVVL